MKDITLIENEPKAFEEAMNDEMKKATSHFEGELAKIRTGRAHTSLVEDIKVDCYDGSPMALKNVAALSAADARMIVIQPWDISTIPAIERALMGSDVGITPQVDGKIIRLVLPEMSSTRREELIKILGKKLEECKVSIRNIRKDFNNLTRDAKKDKKISENFFNRLGDLVQTATDKWIAKADQMAQKKEKELKSF
jgi:ribosome recycling factor